MSSTKEIRSNMGTDLIDTPTSSGTTATPFGYSPETPGSRDSSLPSLENGIRNLTIDSSNVHIRNDPQQPTTPLAAAVGAARQLFGLLTPNSRRRNAMKGNQNGAKKDHGTKEVLGEIWKTLDEHPNWKSTNKIIVYGKKKKINLTKYRKSETSSYGLPIEQSLVYSSNPSLHPFVPVRPSDLDETPSTLDLETMDGWFELDGDIQQMIHDKVVEDAERLITNRGSDIIEVRPSDNDTSTNWASKLDLHIMDRFFELDEDTQQMIRNKVAAMNRVAPERILNYAENLISNRGSISAAIVEDEASD